MVSHIRKLLIKSFKSRQVLSIILENNRTKKLKSLNSKNDSSKKLNIQQFCHICIQNWILSVILRKMTWPCRNGKPQKHLKQFLMFLVSFLINQYWWDIFSIIEIQYSQNWYFIWCSTINLLWLFCKSFIYI